MAATEIDTLIFDIDDTMYPVDNGFTIHRHSEVPPPPTHTHTTQHSPAA